MICTFECKILWGLLASAEVLLDLLLQDSSAVVVVKSSLG